MGVRVPEEAPIVYRPRPVGPPLVTALGLALVVLTVLMSNGRPIGAGDTRATERVAASLVQELDFDLDEFPEVEEPFARSVGEHRVSIYPVLSAVLASPVFAVVGMLFPLDENGSALAGKIAASLLSALAAAVLFLAIGRRRSEPEAWWTAGLFAVGTSVWSTSQALWQHPAAVLFLALTLLFLLKAEDDPAWADRAGLTLAAMVAARHADVVLGAVLAAAIAARWPARVWRLALWAIPPVAFVLVYNWMSFGSPLSHGFSGSLGRFSAPWGTGQLGLLLSPGKGLLVFTPVVIMGIAGLRIAYRNGERWLALTASGAAVAHWLFVGRWAEWHGGESWGPRLMTDVLPLLFLCLPEGFDLWPRLTRILAVLSVVVQALGALCYDYRWERLYQREPAGGAELWSVDDNPIFFYARRRVAHLALPGLREGKLVIREHPVVPFGPEGSRVTFAGEGVTVLGSEKSFGDVFIERGGRVEGGRLHLRGRWSGVFLRVTPAARDRQLELRIAGRGQGYLYVGESSFWSAPRFSSYPMAGSFLIRHRYHYPESGGGDVTITVGKGGGDASLEWVALVPVGDAVKPVLQ